MKYTVNHNLRKKHKKDKYGKNIVYEEDIYGDIYNISVNNSTNADFITLWKNEKKIGELSANLIEYGKFKNYMKISYIEIDKKERGQGFGKKMYEMLSLYAPLKSKGLYSYLPDRSNKRQIPSIWGKMGQEIIDGDHAFITFNRIKRDYVKKISQEYVKNIDETNETMKSIQKQNNSLNP